MVIDKLSGAESEMFDILNCGNLFFTPISVFDLYRAAVEQCFIQDYKGKAVESLRRCFAAIVNCKLKRGTKEFNDLIQL